MENVFTIIPMGCRIYFKGKHNIVADALSRLPKAIESIQTDHTFRIEDDFNDDLYIDTNMYSTT